MKKSHYLAALFLLILLSPALSAADYSSGNIRLTLHEGIGRFSLYRITDMDEVAYEPFFISQDPRTSFLAVLFNNRIYRLGESSSFRVRLREQGEDPAIIFDSSLLLVTEEFSFIRTKNASSANGIQIQIRIENKSPAQADVGLRFLLDTSLGEKRETPPFITDRQKINAETAIETTSPDHFWISRNDRLSLMGSIDAEAGKKPDLVLFSNWKRQNEVPWKTAYLPGRNFSYLPYSIGDSSVCYYYDPQPLSRGEEVVYTLFLAAEDEAGFEGISAGTPRVVPEIVPLPVIDDTQETDLALLRSLVARIDDYLADNSDLTEEELASIEQTIAMLRARYRLP
ncbi:MAG: hypothetical protein LBN21_07695 [Treponema sp.]|nr:hypothetical protein [Treponema sp.]